MLLGTMWRGSPLTSTPCRFRCRREGADDRLRAPYNESQALRLRCCSLLTLSVSREPDTPHLVLLVEQLIERWQVITSDASTVWKVQETEMRDCVEDINRG